MTVFADSIFNYIDYRQFLAEYYAWNKGHTRGFSHRAMCDMLGFNSPNFLKLVIDGKRNIGKESLPKIADGLELNKQETEYFSYLVFFASAKSSIDKNYYFGLIASMRAQKNIRVVSAEQCEYFSEWYHPAIREIIAGKSDPLDFEAFSLELGKKVSPSRIRKSVDLLKRLGLIIYDETKGYLHSAPILNTQNEIHTFAIRQYHKAILGIAERAIDDIPPAERENSHVTARISRDGFLKIKTRIQEFREELLQIIAEDPQANSIYHINFQLYPITKSINT
jgi:uncharacterized protein (TIGR02147 family)